MLTNSRRQIAFPSHCIAARRPFSTAIVALGLALAAAPALADSDYPPGLFENSPVVGPNGAQVAPPQSGATAPSTSNPPATSGPPSVPGASGEATASGQPDYAAPSEPPGVIPRRTTGGVRAPSSAVRLLRRNRQSGVRQSRGGAAGARDVRRRGLRGPTARISGPVLTA